jgi:ATP-dependent exoDNAse (exonuclease V) beta subunit
LKEIKDAKKKLSREEEDRILYVATTRAKKRLILGFPPPEKKNSPLSLSKLAASLQGLEKVTRLQKRDGAEKAPPREEKPIETSLLKPLQKARLTRFAVTELECFLRSKEEYLERYVHRLPPVSFRSRWEKRKENDPPHFDPLERGTLLHETLYFMTEAHPHGSLREAFQSAWDRRFHLHDQREAYETLMESLDRTLKHPNFQPILKPDEGYSEIPFLLNLSPYEVRGAMDRLIRLGEQWVVVDYKTHTEPDETTGRGFEFQMKTYCLAAGRMLGRDVREARLYFVVPNSIHPFRFSKKELKAHEESLVAFMEEINEWRGTLE